MKKIDYFLPKNLSEALDILDKKDMVIFCGGTDLGVRNSAGKNVPLKIEKDILFIREIEELRRIEKKNDFIEIGAALTYSELLESGVVPNILKQAIAKIAAPVIRNLGTLGGNICNASPAGDSLPVLYSLNAKLLLKSQKGERLIALKDFITAPGRKNIEKNEILEKIIIESTNWHFAEFRKVGTRKAQALSKLSVCFIGEKDGNFRLSFGAVAPRIVREEEIEKKIKNMESINFIEFSELYDKSITPIDDQRSTAEYRKFTALKIGYDMFEKFRTKF